MKFRCRRWQHLRAFPRKVPRYSLLWGHWPWSLSIRTVPIYSISDTRWHQQDSWKFGRALDVSHVKDRPASLPCNLLDALRLVGGAGTLSPISGRHQPAHCASGLPTSPVLHSCTSKHASPHTPSEEKDHGFVWTAVLHCQHQHHAGIGSTFESTFNSCPGVIVR